MKKCVLKIILAVVLIVVGFILLFPKVYHFNDGGTVEYRAVLYQVVKFHSLNLLLDDEYDDGLQINILGFQVYRKLDSDDRSHFVERDETDKQMIQVKGVLYYNTGKESTITARCGTMDGFITSHTDIGKVPTVDNQANFDGDYGYQYGSKNTLEIFMDGKWIVFASKNPSFIRTYTIEHIKQGEEEDSYYVTLSIFQGEIETVLIRNLVQPLEVGKTYEFTFYRDYSKPMEDTIQSIFENSLLETIEETDKVGLEQVQDSIFFSKN